FDRNGDMPPVEIRGSGRIRRGTTKEQRLHVRNDESFEQWYGTAANVEGSHPWFHGRIEPASQLFSVPAREEREIAFHLSIGAETAPGLYHLAVFTTHHLSWNVSVKPILVTP